MPQKYKDYQPSAWDSPSNFMAHTDINYLKEWLVVPCSRTRDSSIREESNFFSALELLGGESETVEVHRFGHWACGWYEIILVAPQLESKVNEIEEGLENDPIINDDDYYKRVLEEASNLWEHARVRDRIEWIKEYGQDVSIFAARRDELPQGIDEEGLVI